MPFSERQRFAHFDVFNGDADGICALHQLRLVTPVEGAHLVTGVKRDIALLNRLGGIRDSKITVLDVSLDINRHALIGLLAAGNEILYIDHHYAGEIPDAVTLTTHIDPAPDRCTSLIVDHLLGGRFRLWALCGAFGDNLHAVATAMAADCRLSDKEIAVLREIGELLNYNGYGSDLHDLYFPPDRLYQSISAYKSPFAFHAQSKTLKTLKTGFVNDMSMALGQPVFSASGANRIFRLPDSPGHDAFPGYLPTSRPGKTPKARMP
jgi:hypothetical protein